MQIKNYCGSVQFVRAMDEDRHVGVLADACEAIHGLVDGLHFGFKRSYGIRGDILDLILSQAKTIYHFFFLFSLGKYKRLMAY